MKKLRKIEILYILDFLFSIIKILIKIKNLKYNLFLIFKFKK